MRIASLLFALLASLATPALAQDNSKLLEAFGAVSAQCLYNTYLAIGAVADAYAAEAYTAETVTTLMDEQTSMLSSVNGYNKGLLSESGLKSTDDRTYVRNLQRTNEKLALMASSLKAYVNGDGTSDAFQNARTSAWADISKLLGIDDSE